jgi:hypothetical protein
MTEPAAEVACARNLAAVELGIIEIAERPRNEGETAFPALGTILQEVSRSKRRLPPTPDEEKEREERRAAEQAEKELEIESVKGLRAIGEAGSSRKTKSRSGSKKYKESKGGFEESKLGLAKICRRPSARVTSSSGTDSDC